MDAQKLQTHLQYWKVFCGLIKLKMKSLGVNMGTCNFDIYQYKKMFCESVEGA